MPAASAGILLYRHPADGPAADRLEVLLGHPGGPFWARRDAGAWTMPKGEIGPGEDAAQAARREFAEETGVPPPGALRPLGRIRQRGGKWVDGFAVEGDFDPAALRSNVFEIEWPPRSGRIAAFPELDRVAWFTLREARQRILPGQAELLDRLETLLG